MASRQRADGAGRRRGLAGLAPWWMMALAVHLAWVPNLVHLLRLAPDGPAGPVLQVTAVAVPASTADRGARGAGPSERSRPAAEVAGAAPSGRPAEESGAWLVLDRTVPFERQVAAASRALRSAAPQPASPARPGRDGSARHAAASPAPGAEDHETRGAPRAAVSYATESGARGEAPASRRATAAGTASRGRLLPAGEGSAGAASNAAGPEEASAESRRGAEPVLARPAVDRGPEAAEAAREAGGTGAPLLRQASPRVALAPSVRESRVSSGRLGLEDQGARTARERSSRGAGLQAAGPAAGGRGEAETGAGRAREPLYDAYFRSVLERVRQHWGPYPERLAYDLQQGLVVLQIRVRHDGRVERVAVQRSSGFEEFDQRAVQAVRRAAPLAPPPPELLFLRRSDFLVLDLPMRYRNPMFE